MEKYKYCHSLTDFTKRKTIEVAIGSLPMGALNPIRVQSMTTCNTMDTSSTVEQIIRMVDSGCEYVRITAPSITEAKHLKYIKQKLLAKGVNVPLIADIHYTPNAAIEAAKHVEKVRINPGNYSDKKLFNVIEYTDKAYNQAIEHVRLKFTPLLKQCKKYGTAMRIGTNHGSLSDRILSRYGDTPMGMVESALEFVRICEDESYFNIVLSMKASNTRVMVQAYRLLVNKLEQEGLKPYPLHLGVTEAGDGEDGRIKSAVGIGSLLEDGLGDTIRVSLTEDPELEIPVAQSLIKRYSHYKSVSLKDIIIASKNPFEYQVRSTLLVEDFGDNTSPRIIANYSTQLIEKKEDIESIGYRYISTTDKWTSLEAAADYIFLGKKLPKITLPSTLKSIIEFSVWNKNTMTSNTFPLFNLEEYSTTTHRHPKLNFLRIDLDEESIINNIDAKTVLVAETTLKNPMHIYRQFILGLMHKNIMAPVVLAHTYTGIAVEVFQLHAAIDMGGILIDGLANGIMLQYNESEYSSIEISNSTGFKVLQATRTRMSKTEYISCPSCGRTLFDLQSTTEKIKKRTDHLKGVKIGIMGCIVNGPGEMADADYGYVGVGIKKISLYKGKEVVKKGLSPDVAVDELIQLIKEDNNWVEPEKKH